MPLTSSARTVQALALLAVSVALLASGVGARPALAAGDRAVTSFEAEVQVGSDGVVRVVERLTYELGGGGDPVVRRLPRTASVDGAPERDLGLAEVRVIDDAGVQPVSVDEGPDATEVVIGAEGGGSTPSGSRTFEIGYEYRDLLRDSGDGPRLFLDVVGTGWSIPVRGVRADLSLPGEPVRVDCYAGAPGSHGACTGAESSGTGAVFAQDEVAPGEAMSIDVGIDPADLDVSVPGAEEGSGPDFGALFSSMFTPLVVLLAVLFALRHRGSGRHSGGPRGGRRGGGFSGGGGGGFSGGGGGGAGGGGGGGGGG